MSTTYVPPANPSPELRTVLAWIDACNKWEVSAFAAQMSDDEYHHAVLPSSLGVPESKTKAEWLAHSKLASTPSLILSRRLKVHEIIEAPEGRIIGHVSASGKTKLGIDFANEYMILCTVRKDSSGQYKMVKVKEFMDSKSVSSFHAAVQAATAGAS